MELVCSYLKNEMEVNVFTVGTDVWRTFEYHPVGRFVDFFLTKICFVFWWSIALVFGK